MVEVVRPLALAVMVACISAGASDDPEARARARCPGAAKFEDASAADVRRSRRSSSIAQLPALRAELQAMYDADQAARLAQMTAPSAATLKQLIEVDTRNLARIKVIIAEHGFPATQLVDNDGVQHAWLLVQHADADPALQEDVLHQIGARNNAVTPEEIALLTDRVLRAKGRPQLYGTQFERQDDHWAAQPTQNLADLDARRATMHLMPIADYSCFINALYEPAP